MSTFLSSRTLDSEVKTQTFLSVDALGDPRYASPPLTSFYVARFISDNLNDSDRNRHIEVVVAKLYVMAKILKWALQFFPSHSDSRTVFVRQHYLRGALTDGSLWAFIIVSVTDTEASYSLSPGILCDPTTQNIVYSPAKYLSDAPKPAHLVAAILAHWVCLCSEWWLLSTLAHHLIFFRCSIAMKISDKMIGSRITLNPECKLYSTYPFCKLSKRLSPSTYHKKFYRK